MKPRDVFKIIVATVGLIGFGYGVLYLLDGVLAALGSFPASRGQASYFAARGVVEIIIGLLFMKGIPPFVDLAFPPSEPTAAEKSAAEKEAGA